MQGGEPHNTPLVSRFEPTIWKLAASAPFRVQHEPEKAGLDGVMTGAPMVPTTVPDDAPGGKVVPDRGTEAMV